MKNKYSVLKVNTKNVDRFSMFAKILYFFGIIILVAFAISVFFSAGKIIYDYYHNIERRLNPNVLEELNDKYSKDFKIISASVDEDGFGVYSLYYKEDQNVVFNVVKDKETLTIYDDFNYRYKKYYIDNYNNSNVKKNLKIKEKYIELNGCQILIAYEFWFEISNYKDIEDTTNNLYELYEYFLSTAKNPYILIVGGLIRQNNYISNISFEYTKNKSLFIQETQEDYKKYFSVL